MFATVPVRGRQDARRTLGGLHIHDYDEALLFYIFYEQLFRMSIAGERCFGLGEPRYARHFPNKGSTMDPQDVHWATGGLHHEWLNILHSLTFSLSPFSSIIIVGKAAVAETLVEIRRPNLLLLLQHCAPMTGPQDVHGPLAL